MITLWTLFILLTHGVSPLPAIQVGTYSGKDTCGAAAKQVEASVTEEIAMHMDRRVWRVETMCVLVLTEFSLLGE